MNIFETYPFLRIGRCSFSYMASLVSLQSVPDIAWGKRTHVILDVGCGVASFGGYLFERDVLAMSFAPKDEHEAQIQMALERGIPAISAVMGSQRLPFPSKVFDLVHCARCRVPWHADGIIFLSVQLHTMWSFDNNTYNIFFVLR